MDKQKTENSSKNGNAPCGHPSLAKEFASGAPTGNYYCTQCNRLLSSIIGANAVMHIKS
ncbi:MAG: hypothetical protein ACXV7J_13700 [Methylomonas sp.]